MASLIERSRHYKELQGLLQRHPVVGILGARQVRLYEDLEPLG